MAVENASRDQSTIPTLLGVSNADGTTPIKIYGDPTTHRLLVDNGGSSTINFADEEIPSGTVNGVNVTFTLAHIPSPAASLQLFVNGAQQWQNAAGDYTLSSSTITFLSAPLTGSTIICWYRY